MPVRKPPTKQIAISFSKLEHQIIND